MNKSIPGSGVFPERLNDHNINVLGGTQARQCFEMYLRDRRTTPPKPETIDWRELKELLQPHIDSNENWVLELDPVFAGDVLRFVEDMKQSIATDSNAVLSRDRLYLACSNTPIDSMSPAATREAGFLLALLYKYDLLLSQPSQPSFGQQQIEVPTLDILI